MKRDKAARGHLQGSGQGGHAAAAREKAARVQEEQARIARRRTVLRILTVGVGAVVVAALAAVLVLSLGDESSPIGDAGTTGSVTTPSNVTEDGAVVVGDPDARVAVQVVEDFQCPACQQFEAVAGGLLDELASGGEVRVEYRGIAFLDQASTTRYSSRALNASACVMGEGEPVWKEFHRQLFLIQPAEGGDGLPDSALVESAVGAGADEAAVASCVEDQTYAGWVAATTVAAGEDGVNGTPTVFVDGEPLSDLSPAGIQAAVDEALNR